MNRTLRGIVGCGFLSLLIVLSFGAVGCGGNGGTTCTTNADCTAPEVCNAGTCGAAAPTGGCATDADCGEGKVCDSNAGSKGTCFDKCTTDADCSEGDACDTTLNRCSCATTAEACAKRGTGSEYSCHPVTNICSVICSADTQCGTDEKCDGPTDKKVCLDPADVNHICAADGTGCTAPEVCDTAAFPRKCVAPAGCSADADCISDPAKTKCDTTTKECLACLGDTDCTGANETCDIDGTCKPAATCTTSAACNTATAGNICADPAAPCAPAVFDCTADKKASGNDSWKTDFPAGSGSAIYKVEARRLSDAKSCSDFPSGAAKCADNSECSSGEICSTVIKKCVASCDSTDDCDSGSVCNKDLGDIPNSKGACVVGIPNGTVEIKFSFFNPGGKFKTGQDMPKNSIVQLHDDGGIATEVTLEGGGTQTEGSAQFSFCDSSGSGSFSFFVKDEDGKPSNHGCYTLTAP